MIREIANAVLNNSSRTFMALYTDFDVTQFARDLRAQSVTPHITIDGHLSKTGKRRKTAVGGRTKRHVGYGISQTLPRNASKTCSLDQELSVTPLVLLALGTAHYIS